MHENRVHGSTSDENIFMTRMVCRTIVPFFVIAIGPVHHEVYSFERKKGDESRGENFHGKESSSIKHSEIE